LQRKSGDMAVAFLCHDSIIAQNKLSVNRCITANLLSSKISQISISRGGSLNRS
jgi:hypothetical protein